MEENQGTPTADGPGAASASGITTRSPWPRVVVILGALVVVGATAVAGIALWPDDDQQPAVMTPTESPSAAVTATPADEESQELSAQEIAQLFGSAVFKVEADGCGYLGTGTAFAVGPRTLITNAHVITNDAAPTVAPRDGDVSLNTKVAGADEQLDVAVLITDEDLPEAASLSWTNADELSEGQGLVALGYPVPDHSFAVTPATVMSFQTDGDSRQALRLDGLVDKGNSGGPALTATGEVAGVVTYLSDGGFQWIPVAHTYDYLAATIDTIEREMPGWTVNCDDIPETPTVPEEWEWDEEFESEFTGPDGYGDDPVLDQLHDECRGGDMEACDELYWNSPYGSEYEAFASSCGESETTPAHGFCSWLYDETIYEEDPPEPWGFGDDPYLDELWIACDDGDMDACDDLYWDAPAGSDYETFGATCGMAESGYGLCAFGDDPDWLDLPVTYGDDAYLDELWDECEAGDLLSCDLLYFSAEIDSDYEEFGATCGRRNDPVDGDCW